MELPLKMEYLNNRHDTHTVDPTEGENFLISCETASVFKLDPGVYSLIVFLDQPGIHKDYVLSLAYRKTANIGIQVYNIH